MEFKLGELFCGAGGLAWGAINAGSDRPIERNGERFTISHAWANDFEPSACQTYAANIVLNGESSLKVINQAIVSADEWRQRYRENRNAQTPSVICGSVEQITSNIENLPEIDGFAFGFPCNDFSAVGERKGLDGEFGPLYTHGLAVLNHHRPRWFVAENVEGLKHQDKGRVYEQICAELSEAGRGYKITSHLYNFEDYGVAQRRTRLVIVGISQPDYRQGIVFRVPQPTTEAAPHTARWALEHDPTAPDILKPLTKDDHNHLIKKPSERVRKRLEHTLPGQNAWNADIPPEYALKVKNAHLSMIYRRLEAEQPAYTITGNGGGGTHGYHWDELRALTSRERARLQSFPDAYRFYGNESSVRKQIGMAVPPLAAKHIFEAILKTYAGIEYPCATASDRSVQRGRRRASLNLSTSQQQMLLPITVAEMGGAE